MSGQLRAIKNRIRSVENTKKITHAMEMVSAAKLRRFQDMMVKAKPYTEGLESLVTRLLQDQLARNRHAERSEASQKSRFFGLWPQNDAYKSLSLHPFFEQRDEKRTALVFFTSDTGLCGSYNTDLTGLAKGFLEKQETKNPVLISVGKIGTLALKQLGLPVLRSFHDLRVSRVETILKEIKTVLEDLFLNQKVDAIYMLYSHFLTLSTYRGTVEKLLPFNPPADTGEKANQETSDYLYEPNPGLIFQKLIPVYFEAKIRMIFLESFVSEQIARMTAMRQATDNAEEMIESLVLVRNKARQASITKEIIEIISGSRAQKIK